MKQLILTGLILIAVNLGVLGQNPGVRHPTGFPPAHEDLPRFDLDFPGGTPQHLVEAIQAQIGTLNAIVPTEHKDLKLPPMKMKTINVKELFEALEAASRKQVLYRTGTIQAGPILNRSSVSERTTSFGFQTIPPVRPESVWSFHVTKPIELAEQKNVRYFQLKAFLEEYKIDDISTAIQAGWNMLGDENTPQLNFHEDTKLLIAVGQPQHLDMIADALKELGDGIVYTQNQKVRPMPPTKTEDGTKKF